MKSLQRLIAVFASLCLAPSAFADQSPGVSNVWIPHASSRATTQIGVSDAWIPQAPPGAAMLAGYLTIKNDSDAPVSILAAESDRFRTVSVHQTVIENGVARMRELHSLEIAPGKEVKFAPGGMHLMLMQPRKAVEPGDHIEITLLFSDGTRVPAIFDVQAADVETSEGHDHPH